MKSEIDDEAVKGVVKVAVSVLKADEAQYHLDRLKLHHDDLAVGVSEIQHLVK